MNYNSHVILHDLLILNKKLVEVSWKPDYIDPRTDKAWKYSEDKITKALPHDYRIRTNNCAASRLRRFNK